MPPLNLVGDYGGGALYLVVGILAALLEAQKSGQGQVVDVAMCDGAASLMSLFCELTAIGRWKDGRESNLLDGGAHFYGTYECKDGEFISLGSIEPQFYAELRRLAGLDDALYDGQMDAKNWPAMKAKMVEVFKTKTRAEWCAIMEGTDVCFAPVLSLSEAPTHPHMAERKIFVDVDGITQPAPAPRFSRTPSAIRKTVAAELADVAKEWGGGAKTIVPRTPRARSTCGAVHRRAGAVTNTALGTGPGSASGMKSAASRPGRRRGSTPRSCRRPSAPRAGSGPPRSIRTAP